MKHTDILKRAWGMLWGYRALWIFGVILALTTSSMSAWFWVGDHEEWESQGLDVVVQDGETFWMALDRTIQFEFSRAEGELNQLLAEAGLALQIDLVKIFWTILAVCLSLFVLTKIAAYISHVALIRMVDSKEESGQMLKARQGFRLGFSLIAVRFFLIDVLVVVFGFVAFIGLFGLASLFLLPWLGGSEPVIFIGAILTSTLFLLAIALMIIIGATLSVFKIFFHRACAIEGLGVFAAIRRGLYLAWEHKGEVFGMFLIQTAIKMLWAPLAGLMGLVLLALAFMLSGLSGLAVGGLTNLFTSGDTHIFLAVGFGLVLFFLLLFAPLILLQGWLNVFISSIWTLTFRDLRSLEGREPARVSEIPTLGSPSPA